jgi:hypothetical protein
VNVDGNGTKSIRAIRFLSMTVAKQIRLTSYAACAG